MEGFIPRRMAAGPIHTVLRLAGWQRCSRFLKLVGIEALLIRLRRVLIVVPNGLGKKTEELRPRCCLSKGTVRDTVGLKVTPQ